MGLFGGSKKWKCQACGEVHRRNPSECSNCGHTVFKPHGGWGPSSKSSASSSRRASGGESRRTYSTSSGSTSQSSISLIGQLLLLPLYPLAIAWFGLRLVLAGIFLLLSPPVLLALVLLVGSFAALVPHTSLSTTQVAPQDLGSDIDAALNQTAAGMAGIVNLSAVGAIANATPSTKSQSPPRDSTTGTRDSAGLTRATLEREIHERINEIRQDNGLQTLNADSRLRDIARYHSEDMAQADYFAHTSPGGESMGDRYEKFGYECRASTGTNTYLTGGENIAMRETRSTDEERVARRIVSQWMNSRGHRKNILEPAWDDEGIGVVIELQGGQYRVYATQNFC